MTTETFDRVIAEELDAFIKNARGKVPEAGQGGMVNRHEQYWRFCTDETCMKPGHVKQRGFIKVGPSLKSRNGAIDFENYKSTKHAEPLPQYGQYEVGYELHTNYSARNPFGPFTPLISQPGGINEFPREQIIHYGWHRHEVIRKARPDLNDQMDVKCPYGCAGRLFPDEDAKLRHVQAVHDKQMISEAMTRPIEKMTEALKDTLARETGGNTELVATVVAAVMAAMKGGTAPAPELNLDEIPEPEMQEEPAEEVEMPLLNKDELRRTPRPR